MDSLTPTIGVAITTRNRPRQLTRCINRLRQHTPPGTPIIIVDDASNPPAQGATYRFEQQAGIARAKNKCLELLDNTGVDHLFLFDDDCWPLHPHWWKPYVESPYPHLMYIFPVTRPTRIRWKITHREPGHLAWNRPCGCMLYITRDALHKVGGMRLDFGLWGGEHTCWSRRIHNHGLTPHPFMDVKPPRRLIYSMDEHWKEYKPEDFTRSIDAATRTTNGARNTILEKELANRLEFVAYRADEYFDNGVLNSVVDNTILNDIEPQARPHVHPVDIEWSNRLRQRGVEQVATGT